MRVLTGLLFCAVVASAALLGHGSGQSTNGSDFTTAGMNLSNSGAASHALVVVFAASVTGGTVTDSLSNTWTPLTGATNSTFRFGQIWYSCNAAVGSTQTFTFTGGASQFGALTVTSWSGIAPTACLVQSSRSSLNDAGGETSIQAGAVTASAGNLLILGCMGANSGGTYSTSSPSMTQSDQTPLSGGISFGSLMAYLVLGSSGSQNPTCSTTGSSDRMTAALAAFAGPSMTVFPGSLGVGLTAARVHMTGTMTSWSGTPFSVSGVAGVSISSQIVYSNTSADISLTTSGAVGTLTVSDGSISTTLPITPSPPTISNLAVFPASSRGVVVQWDTSASSDTEASCGPAGGPYASVSPVINRTANGYGVTHHVVAVTGLSTSVAANSVGCYVYSTTSGASTGTAGPATGNTMAAFSSATYRLLSHSPSPLRYDDQFLGQHGVTSTGRGYSSDTFFCTWAGDGNSYCTMNDSLGPFATQTAYVGSGYNTGLLKMPSGSGVPTLTFLGVTNGGPNETGPINTANWPTTYTSDGARPFLEGIISPGDGCQYITMTRFGVGWNINSNPLCTTVTKSCDNWQTVTGNQNNTGPSASTKNFNASAAGLVDYPTTQAGCSNTNVFHPWWLRMAQDYGGPWTGSAWTNTVTHVGGTEAWVYAFPQLNQSTGGDVLGHYIARIHRGLMQETHLSDVQVYTGSGNNPADIYDDTKWVPWAGSTGVGTPWLNAVHGYKCQPHLIPSPVNRFWAVCWQVLLTGAENGGMGASIWDLGASLTNMSNATLVGFVPVDKITWQHWGVLFPQLLMDTMHVNSDGTFSIRLSSTGSFQHITRDASTESYSSFFTDLVFGPAIPMPAHQYPRLPQSGLALFYTFDPKESTGGDIIIPNHAQPSFPLTAGPQAYVQSDMGGEFGVYSTTVSVLSMATGFTANQSDFTAAVLFEHNSDLMGVNTECPFQTPSSLALCRFGPSANSWNVSVNGATSSSFTMVSDTGSNHMVGMIMRRSGSSVTVYTTGGMAALPLTALTSMSVSGALSGGQLYLGAQPGGTNQLYGTIGAFAYWTRSLSDSEVVAVGKTFANICKQRGVILQ